MEHTSKSTLAAIGGKEFLDSIGATNVTTTLPALSFDFPGSKRGANCCSIAFRDGLYRIALAHRHGWKTTVKFRVTNVLPADLVKELRFALALDVVP